MYKESGKLNSHYGYEAIGEMYQQNDGRNGSQHPTRHLYLKTEAKQLDEEEKKNDVWRLAEKDARNTHPMSSNCFVMTSERWLPLEVVLSPGH